MTNIAFLICILHSRLSTMGHKIQFVCSTLFLYNEINDGIEHSFIFASSINVAFGYFCIGEYFSHCRFVTDRINKGTKQNRRKRWERNENTKTVSLLSFILKPKFVCWCDSICLISLSYITWKLIVIVCRMCERTNLDF